MINASRTLSPRYASDTPCHHSQNSCHQNTHFSTQTRENNDYLIKHMSNEMIADMHDLIYPIFVFVYTVVRNSFVLFMKH